MKTVPLTKGCVALVDDEDYERISLFKWQTSFIRYKAKTWKYGRRTVRPRGNGKRFQQKLHRFVLGITDSSIHVDHVDGDGLNCQKVNLRVATRTQNMGNRKMNSNNSSGFKGVSWYKSTGRWKAQIMRNGIKNPSGISIHLLTPPMHTTGRPLLILVNSLS